MKAVRSGMSKSDIEGQVFTELGRRSLDKVMGETGLLRGHFRKWRGIDQAIGKATTDAEANQAFAEPVEDGETDPGGEGAGGRSRRPDSWTASWEKGNRRCRHTHDWRPSGQTSFFYAAAAGRRRSQWRTSCQDGTAAYLDKELAAIDELWNGFQSEEERRRLAMAKAVGTKDPEMNQAMLALQDVHDSWVNFFQTAARKRGRSTSTGGGSLPGRTGVAGGLDGFDDKMDQMYAGCDGTGERQPEPVSRDLRHSFDEQFPGVKADALRGGRNAGSEAGDRGGGEYSGRARATRARDEGAGGRILDHTASGKPVRDDQFRTDSGVEKVLQEVYQPGEAGIGRHPRREQRYTQWAATGSVVALTPLGRPGAGVSGVSQAAGIR